MSDDDLGVRRDAGDASQRNADATAADSGAAPALRPSYLPASIAMPGGTSAMSAIDLDGDGYQDLVFYSQSTVNGERTSRYALTVAWGRGTRGALELSSVPTSIAYPHAASLDPPSVKLAAWWYLRDRSARLFATSNAQGRNTVFANVGMLSSTRQRALTLTPFQGGQAADPRRDEDVDAQILPVAMLSKTELVRAAVRGGFERCDIGTLRCSALTGDPAGLQKAYHEFAVGDFDGDGKLDIVGGNYDGYGVNADGSLILGSYLWPGATAYTRATFVPGLESVQLNVVDLNKDGVDDLVAMHRERVSDFPGYSALAYGERARAGASTTFRVQADHFRNYDNHQDTPALLDINRDGHIDLVHAGGDVGVGYMLGIPGGFARSGRFAPTPLSSTRSIGVQAIDINGDGVAEIVSRKQVPSDGWDAASKPGGFEIVTVPSRLP